MTRLLENLVVFMLDIHLWSGRKKLRPEDLALNGIDINKLPPGTLASLGSKRIIGLEAIAPFAALKREAEKLCLAQGVRFLGGYAVPIEAAEALAEKLTELRLRFESAREELLLTYDTEVHRWVRENPPQWAPVIRAAIEPATSVHRALQFNFAPMAVSSPAGMPEELDQQAAGLFGQLCHEVRVAAKNAFESSYVGRSSVTRKALRPIAAIRQKLAGLCFLDPEIVDTLAAIDDTLARLPKTGPIEGIDLNMVAGLLGRQLAKLGQPPAATTEEGEGFDEDSAEECMLPMAQLGASAPRPTVSLSWDF